MIKVGDKESPLPYPFMLHGRSVAIGSQLFSLKNESPKRLTVAALYIGQNVVWTDKEFQNMRAFDEEKYVWPDLLPKERVRVCDWAMYDSDGIFSTYLDGWSKEKVASYLKRINRIESGGWMARKIEGTETEGEE